MAIQNTNARLLLLAVAVFVLSGCAALGVSQEVWWAGAPGLTISEREMEQVRNCGPNQQSSPQLDKLCGKSEISFEAASAKRYPPTKLEKIEAYKIVIHNKYKGETKTVKDEKPSRPYDVIGTLKVPNGVYYNVQLDEFLKEKLSEVGAHGLLEYRLNRDAVGWYQDKKTGKGHDVTKLSLEATVFRYKD